MNWDALGAIGELVGGVAVIVSLLYVALQIRDNSRVARATVEKDAALHWQGVMDKLSSNSEFASLFRKGLFDFEVLTADERIQFGAFINQLISAHANQLRMHQQGLLGDDLLHSADRSILGVLGSESGKIWWSSYGANYAESHQQYVNELMSRNDAVSWLESDYMQGT